MSKTEPRRVQILHESFETGWHGARESEYVYTLILNKEEYTDVATLEVVREVTENRQTQSSTTRFKIDVKDLIALITKHGTALD